MLEAVNSVLQIAPLLRQQAEQTSAVDSFAANPERVQRVPPQAPFVSLFVYVDTDLDKAVLQIRDNQTGDVEGQLPSEASLEARARAAAAAERTASAPPPSSGPQSNGESAQSFIRSTAPAAAPQPDHQSSVPSPAAATAQQQAAFAAAARAGNSNAGSMTLFA